VSFQLQAVDRSRLYRSIVEQILSGIESGAFPPGSALPAERLLAARLEVSRGSVREAIRVLEHAGILDVRTGSGTYVTEAGASRAAALRARAVLSGEHSPLDVVVARRALEPPCAESAATQRHETDLAALREALDRQASLLDRSREAAEADLDFHLALAAATHNPVFAMLMERLGEIMRQRLWGELKARSRVGGGGERDVREHAAVLAAVERGDGRRAARAMRDHLDSVERDLLELVGRNGVGAV
jgi:GntR family transcriptional repressor for pyruvate dehydrogenase complex